MTIRRTILSQQYRQQGDPGVKTFLVNYSYFDPSDKTKDRVEETIVHAEDTSRARLYFYRDHNHAYNTVNHVTETNDVHPT